MPVATPQLDQPQMSPDSAWGQSNPSRELWVQTKTISAQSVIFLTYNFILILLFEKDSCIKGTFFLTALYA